VKPLKLRIFQERLHGVGALSSCSVILSWASTTSSTCPGAWLAFNVWGGSGECVDVLVGVVSTPSLVSMGVEVVQQEAVSATNSSSTSKCKSQ